MDIWVANSLICLDQVSKLCEATYTRILAQQLAPKGVSVYACCPGCGLLIQRHFTCPAGVLNQENLQICLDRHELS